MRDLNKRQKIKKKKPDAINSIKLRQNFSLLAFMNTLIGVFVPFLGRFEGCE